MAYRFTVLAGSLISAAAPAHDKSHGWPIYVSISDTTGQRPVAMLIEGHGTAHLGHPDNSRASLSRSDIGFQMYARRINGGVRIEDEPIVIPDGTRRAFDLEDLQCEVHGATNVKDVVCRRKSDGNVFKAQVRRGSLLSFEMRCADQPAQICRYQLKSGKPARPVDWVR